MPKITLTAARGLSADFDLQAQNKDGSVPTQFLSSDALACSVWKGGDTAAVLSPAVAWLDAATARVRVSLDDGDTSPLEFGNYDLMVTASRAGRTAPIVAATLAVAPTPGTAATRPVYCQLSDLLKWAPWLQDVQQESSLEGFADQRADAREWYDDLILRAYRGGGWGNFEHHSAAALAFAGPHRQVGKSTALTQYLAQNKLMLLPEVVKANAFYAVYLVCNGQVNRGDTYTKQAARFLAMAQSQAVCTTAQVDVSGSGYYAFAVPLGSSNTLFM